MSSVLADEDEDAEVAAEDETEDEAEVVGKNFGGGGVLPGTKTIGSGDGGWRGWWCRTEQRLVPSLALDCFWLCPISKGQEAPRLLMCWLLLCWCAVLRLGAGESDRSSKAISRGREAAELRLRSWAVFVAAVFEAVVVVVLLRFWRASGQSQLLHG